MTLCPTPIVVVEELLASSKKKKPSDTTRDWEPLGSTFIFAAQSPVGSPGTIGNRWTADAWGAWPRSNPATTARTARRDLRTNDDHRRPDVNELEELLGVP